MVASKESGETRPAHLADSDIDYAGYDPYIVAITGVDHASARNDATSSSSETLESRKAKLMTWLRENSV